MSFCYPSNIHFECDGCALCCSDTKHKTRCILLLESDARAILLQTNLKLEEFTAKTSKTQPYKYEMRKSANGRCFFLENNRCVIYERRPLVCRFYPFELKFDEDRAKYLFSFTLECPMIKQGPLLDKKYFEELFALARQQLP